MRERGISGDDMCDCYLGELQQETFQTSLYIQTLIDLLTSWWFMLFLGVIACIWFIAWMLLVHDTPADHPRISKPEKDYIEKSIGVKQV